MAVVTHHPVVVQLKGIGLRFFAINEYLAVLHHQVVTLVGTDGPLVDGDIIHVQGDGLALFRNPDGSVVVSCPVQIAVQRVDVPLLSLRIQGDVVHVALSFQFLYGTLRQRHVAQGVQTHQVLHRDAEVLHHLVAQPLFQFQAVGVLHILWFLIGLPI